ncbi:MAG: hypothetical protein HYX50_01855 [Chloroflexi bacterium]|nr:hypothetical protein [Chloroflexota bacterium]
MQVPAFLLRRLYVKGSLRNTADGFAFDLKNSLGSGHAEQMLPLTVDGVEVPPDAASFVVDDIATPFTDVSAANPVTLAMNRVVTVTARSSALSAGKHKVGIGFIVGGMGTMQFDVTDVVAEAERVTP